MSFNRTVLTVATVVFVILLTITALMIKKSYGKKMYPPEIPKCPHQWAVQDNGDCKWNGKGNPEDPYFSTGHIYKPPALDNLLTRKEKCVWAKQEKVMWEGIWDGVKCEGIK